MIKIFLTILGLLIIATLAIFGFRGQRTGLTPIEFFTDMDRQAKVKSQKPSDFFADGQGDRRPVPGSVPVGYEIPSKARQLASPEEIVEETSWSSNPYAFTVGTDYFHTGRMGEFFGDGLPLPVTAELMERGRERYGIYCAVCHGDAGDGKGVVSQYEGAKGIIASLHQERLRTMPDGEIYNTIAYGKGQMYGYASDINVADRWAIVAYVRALQISQNANVAELPADIRAKIKD